METYGLWEISHIRLLWSEFEIYTVSVQHNYIVISCCIPDSAEGFLGWARWLTIQWEDHGNCQPQKEIILHISKDRVESFPGY